MAPSSRHANTHLMEEIPKKPFDPKPEPHDYYMFLLRTEQGRDQRTRRESNLALQNNTFHPLPYDWFWEADFLHRLRTSSNSTVIFQVIPIPSPGSPREKKLALGFDFATNTLRAWTFDPIPVPFEDLYSRPDIWKECRDRNALSECWHRRSPIISLSMNRFYEIIDFTMDHFNEYGPKMLSGGLLRFFEETTFPFHPSMDLVIVIQFAQFLGDFLDVMIKDYETSKQLLVKYEAYQEFLRNLLLRSSVDVWMTSYDVLKEGMTARGNVRAGSIDTRGKVEKLITEKKEHQHRLMQQQQYVPRDEEDGRQYRAQQYLQQATGPGPVPNCTGPNTWQQASEQVFPESVNISTPELQGWLVLLAVLMVSSMLIYKKQYSVILRGGGLLLGVRLILFILQGRSWDLVALTGIPRLTQWVRNWDYWIIDVLAAITALELQKREKYELLAEEAALWFVLKLIVTICKWNGIDIEVLPKCLLQLELIQSILNGTFQPSIWGLDFWNLPAWYFDFACSVLGVYFILTDLHSSAAQGLIIWFVLRSIIPPWVICKDWAHQFVPHLILFFKYSPFGAFVIFASWMELWYDLLVGLTMTAFFTWTSLQLWKTSTEISLAFQGIETKTLLTWSFATWRISRASNFLPLIPADYFGLAIFAQWALSAGLTAGYQAVIVLTWMYVAWKVHVSEIETVTVPGDILVIFILEWLSRVKLRKYRHPDIQRKFDQPATMRNAWNIAQEY